MSREINVIQSLEGGIYAGENLVLVSKVNGANLKYSKKL
jgi:hypothetical protein